MTRAYLFNQDAGHLTQWFDLYPSAAGRCLPLNLMFKQFNERSDAGEGGGSQLGLPGRRIC
jgi:hypothetical protein